MNHESLGKNKEGIMNNEGQMIPLPPPRKELLLLGNFNMDTYENRDESAFPDTRLADFCNRFCLSNRIDNRQE